MNHLKNSEKPQISGIDNQRITATYSGGLTPSADGVSPRMVTFELARPRGAFEVEH